MLREAELKRRLDEEYDIIDSCFFVIIGLETRIDVQQQYENHERPRKLIPFQNVSASGMPEVRRTSRQSKKNRKCNEWRERKNRSSINFYCTGMYILMHCFMYTSRAKRWLHATTQQFLHPLHRRRRRGQTGHDIEHVAQHARVHVGRS